MRMMKNKRYKSTIIRLCILILAIFLASTAPLDSATVIKPWVPGVTGTKHNFSMYGPGTTQATSTTEVCIFCHTPHFSQPGTPLWNKQDQGTTYVIYSTATMTANTLGQPTGSSRLCLSCHDGAIAIGSLLNAPGAVLADTLNLVGAGVIDPATGALVSTSAANIGIDLSNDHPISFAYSSSYPTNSEVKDPGQNNVNISPAVLDKGGNIQCTACHDPHSSAYVKFLRTALDPGAGNYGAGLCSLCHVKQYWNDIALPVHREENTFTWTGTAGTDPTPWDPYDFGATPSPTTLSSDVDSASTADIQVVSTLGFPDSGRIKIDNELIKYNGTSGGNAFTGIVRGIEGTAGAAHSTGAAVSGNNYTDDDLKTHGCFSCHRSHGGTLGKSLLKGRNADNINMPMVGEEWTCLNCHNGKMKDTKATNTIFIKDINAVLSSTYKHDAKGTYNLHAPKRITTGTPSVREEPANLKDNRHAECADCHNPHSAKKGNHTVGGANGNSIGNNLTGTWGVQPTWAAAGNSASAYTTVQLNADILSFESYLCIKCHSSYAYGTISPSVPSAPATFNESDLSADFNTNNLSFHPVFEAIGKNQPLIAINANWPANGLGLTNTFTCAATAPGTCIAAGDVTHTSTITCSDCHGNSDFSPNAPKGPHGSSNKYILRSNETVQGSTKNFCYNCHRRDVYGDEGYCPPNANYSRVSHPPDQTSCSGSPTSPFYTTGATTGNNSNIFNILCLSCHGGGKKTQNDIYTVFDGIHGSNTGTTGGMIPAIGFAGATPLGTRMMNGACVDGYTKPSAGTGALWFKTTSDADPLVCNYVYSTNSTTLSADIDNVVLTIPVNNTTGFPTIGGRILIDNELIDYESITGNNFNVAANGRGAGGTAAAAHVTNTTVTHGSVTITGNYNY